MISRSVRWLIGFTTLWALTATAGLAFLADYDTRPGDAGTAPRFWPKQSSIVRHGARPTLLLFLHPHCPCSNATFHELERIVRRHPESFDVHAVFVGPFDGSLDWNESALWNSALALRDIQCEKDRDGVLAKQFGAKTSGQVLVYDCDGRLQFNGGITPGRGHVGNYVGNSAVSDLATGLLWNTPKSCAVFGCPILTDSDERFDD